MDNKIVYINEGAKVLRLHMELVNYFSDWKSQDKNVSFKKVW